MNDQSFSFGQYGTYEPGQRDLTSTGSSQTDAAPLLRRINHFGSVPNGSGCMLPLSTSSSTTEVIVINRGGGADLRVYPPYGGTIENLYQDQPFICPVGTGTVFLCFDSVMRPGKQWSVLSTSAILGQTFTRPDQFMQDTPPANPQTSDIWWDSANGHLYMYYNDGTSTQWIDVTGGAALPVVIQDFAPTNPKIGQIWYCSADGQTYLYYDDVNSSQWVPLTNQDFSGAYVATAGGTMTGPLTVNTTIDVDTGIFGGVATPAQRTYPPTSTWVGPDMLYYDLYSLASFYPPPGRSIAVAAAVRTSDNQSTTVNSTCIGVASYAVSNVVGGTYPGFSWVFYGSGRVQQYAGTCILCELSMGNLGPGTAEVNPYQGLGNGAGVGLWLSSGSEAYSQGKTVYPASTAIGVVSNGSTWAKGLMMMHDALTPDPTTGNMKAIQLPAKGEVQWTFDSTGARSSFIRCDATATGGPGITFQNGSFNVVNSAETGNLLQVTNSNVYLPTGQVTISGNAGYPTLALNKTAGGGNQIVGSVGGSDRWILRFGDNDAEGTGNTGSSFTLMRFDNSGNYIDNPLTVNRSTGSVNLSHGLSFGQRSVTTTTDVTQHIALYDGWGGFNICSGSMNMVAGNSVVMTTAGNGLEIKQPTTFDYPVYVTGGTATVSGVAYSSLVVDKTASGGGASLVSGSVGGSMRWQIRLGDNDAEGAGNVGSSFGIYRFDNSGNYIDEPLVITRNDGMTRINGAGGLFISNHVGFNGAAPVAKPTVTGAKGGNAALGSLLTALASYGLITDSTTA